jgi:flagellar motility protein MotE (MotC chaperone)
MIKSLREFRLIPIVLIAVGCLFALKSIGLVLDGGYTLGQRLSGDTLVVTTVPVPAPTQLRSPAAPLEIAGAQPARSWMQEMFNYPDVTGSVAPRPAPGELVTGSTAKAQPAVKEAKAEVPPPAPESRAAAGTVIPMEPRPASAAERALLERLQERRQELDARARELDMRESLLAAAEKKLEARTAEQKTNEGRAGAGGQRKDDGEARFKSVVTMYETMKPKEAAKIFDRLDLRVLMEVASQINPRRMSEILAQMNPEAAERLTVEMANRGGSERPLNPADLPKIEGKPGGS